MPSTDIRLQLFGIALILVGGLRDVVRTTRGFTLDEPSLGVILVPLGLLAVVVGLLGPYLRTMGGASDHREET